MVEASPDSPPDADARVGSLPIAWIVCAVVMLVAAALRWGELGTHWLHSDEGIYFTIANQPIDLARESIQGNAHPPLYYYVMRMVAAVSEDPFALRWPALLFGVLAVGMAFLVGRRLGGWVGGAACGVLLALAPGHIVVSSMARPYAMLTLVLLASVWFALRCVGRSVEGEDAGAAKGDIAGLAIVMTTAAWTHYSALLGLAAIGGGLAWWVLFSRGATAKQRLPVLLAFVPVAISYVWLYFGHLRQLSGGGLQKEAVGGWLSMRFAASIGDLWTGLIGFVEFLFGLPAVAGIVLLLVLGVVVLGLTVSVARVAGLALLVMLLCALFGASVLSLTKQYPLSSTRHSLWLTAFLVPVIGGGFGRAINGPAVWRFAAAGLALVLGIGVVATGVGEGMAPVVGVVADRPQVLTERERSVEEVRAAWSGLDQRLRGDRVVITDQFTAYTLAPQLRAAWGASGRRGSLLLMPRDGASLAVTGWVMTAGPQFDDPFNLASVLPQVLAEESLRAVSRPVYVMGLPSVFLQLEQLARALGLKKPLIGEGWQAGSFAFARLHVAAYQQAVAKYRAAMGKRQAPAGGQGK